MSVLYLVALWVARLVGWVSIACNAASVVLGVWALIDCLTRPAEHFIAAGKRTKGFWLAVNGVGLAVVALTGWASMLGLLGVVANAVYLADVRPALDYYKPVHVRSRVRRPGEKGWRR